MFDDSGKTKKKLKEIFPLTFSICCVTILVVNYVDTQQGVMIKNNLWGMYMESKKIEMRT